MTSTASVRTHAEQEARAQFAAALNAEYHDDAALRGLTDPPPPPPTAPNVLAQLADEGWFAAEVIQRRFDLYGDLSTEGA